MADFENSLVGCLSPEIGEHRHYSTDADSDERRRRARRQTRGFRAPD